MKNIGLYLCYQFRILRNLRIDIKDRLEEYSQSIEIDIHVCTRSQKKLVAVVTLFLLPFIATESGMVALTSFLLIWPQPII